MRTDEVIYISLYVVRCDLVLKKIYNTENELKTFPFVSHAYETVLAELTAVSVQRFVQLKFSYSRQGFGIFPRGMRQVLMQ